MQRSYSSGALALTLAFMLPSSGCLIAGSSSEIRMGKPIAEATFSQVEPGKTTSGWVLATLGEPDKRTKVDGEGTEVWSWNYTQQRESHGAVFLLFANSDKKETKGTTFVEFKDGVVVKKWRG